MPDAAPRRERTAKIESATRQADHAGIDRLAEELLPALIAKLGTTHLGELEVREGDWHVRLRRPYGTAPGEGRRAGDRSSRAQPGIDGHAVGRGAPDGHRTARTSGGASGITAGSGAASASTNGTGPDEDALDKSRAIATSPAVGIFQPGARAVSGTRVRAGDSLGAVNVLGVPQDVLAPVDGVVGSTFVEAGMAVEYGQDLIRIELAVLSSGSTGSAGSSGSGASSASASDG